MRWRLKSKIQNAVSLLPSSLSYAVYYWIQRRFGSLNQRRTNPTSRFTAAIDTWKRILEQGTTPSGKVFFEVGTGRVPHVPMAYWLMGAEKTVTIDLNPYMKSELVAEALQYITKNEESIQRLFGPLMNQERFAQLRSFSGRSPFSLPALLELCQVEYIAPGDAASTRLPDQCVDFHTSYTVFEHIQLEILKPILEEGNRIIKDGGFFVHMIDYADHFAYSDLTISPINFLQYSDDEWSKLAGNRYMYTNRLRHDDFESLYEAVEHRVVGAQPHVDVRVQESLRKGAILLDGQFSAKGEDVLAITDAWMITQKKAAIDRVAA
jgi:hypothetical protein